jgi:hypothetical protein
VIVFFEYIVTILLAVIIVSMRNDIFYYSEKSGKIEYKVKGILSAVFLWFLMAGMVYIIR